MRKSLVGLRPRRLSPGISSKANGLPTQLKTKRSIVTRCCGNTDRHPDGYNTIRIFAEFEKRRFRDFLSGFAQYGLMRIGGVAAMALWAAGISALAAEKPNVLMICVDDLKPALGVYGDKLAKAP